MAWIEMISDTAAEGLLSRLFAAAIQRAGKVYNVIRLQSLRPRVLQASTRLYAELMRGPRGGLTHVQREIIATAVSRANACFY